MANRYIDDKYKSTYNLDKIKKNVTILGNAKNEQLKLLVRSLNQRNISNSINYAIELHISGYFDNVLAKLNNVYFNEINLAQPKAAIYLYQFLDYYNEKYTYSLKKNHPLVLINDIRVRNFICFFITLCCLSNQRKLPKIIKINNDDFDFKKRKKKLISKNLTLISKYITKEDPKEIIIPLSEIVNLIKRTDIVDREQTVIYWLSWLYEYEKKYHNNSLLVKHRNIPRVDNKYCRDFIWIVWDILIDNVSSEHRKIMNVLNNMFKLKFTKTAKKSRSNIIIAAIYLCINPSPKIKISMAPEVYARSNLESLKSNTYYNDMFTKIAFQN